jgi:glycosyltransferase involved in cell wall biosynthesis
MRLAVVVATSIREGLEDEIAEGRLPRRDYFEIARRTGAELVHEEHPRWFAGILSRVLGPPAAHAWIIFRRRHTYDVVHTLSEDVGLPLAFLLRVFRSRKRHVMVAHRLSTKRKRALLRVTARSIDRIIVYGSAQAEAAHRLGLDPPLVTTVLHPADHHFWSPSSEQPADYICSAGLEYRDYPTLLGAVDGTDIETVIAAASPFSRRKSGVERQSVPANVRFVALTPLQLRDVYRRARVVVIPLVDVDFQAGSLVMYEAMACGRPVIASETTGQRDIVRPSETGVLVRPGDPHALRARLSEMLKSPVKAEQMGRRARDLVEAGLNLDTYVAKVVAILEEVARTPIGS